MNDISGFAENAFQQLAESRSSQLNKQAQQLSATSDKSKIERSAREFESILLASWLQSAEKSFATVPGGDDEEKNSDPGKSQFQGYAMQAVASALTDAGGFRIASMIAASLAKTSDGEQSHHSLEAPESHSVRSLSAQDHGQK